MEAMTVQMAVDQNFLESLVDKLVATKVESRLNDINLEKERLRKECWWTDKEIAEGFGKSKLEAQRLLRLMAENPVACRYISKEGGRSTRADVFEKWLMWYEANKYSRGKKSEFRL